MQIIEDFTLEEISAVDVPAVKPAVALIRKAGAYPAAVQIATSVDDGHAHGIAMLAPNREVVVQAVLLPARSAGANEDHLHTMTVAANGDWLVLANAGHGHTIDQRDLKAVFAAAQVKEDQRSASDPAYPSRKLKFAPVTGVQANKSSRETSTMKAVGRAALKAAAKNMAAEPDFAHLGAAGAETIAAVLAVQDSGAQAQLLKALRAGGSEGAGGMDAEDQLDLLAKRRSAAEGVTFAAAYSAILKTDQGMALAESLRWNALPQATQELYGEHFAGLIESGVQKSAARDSNDALRALDAMARKLQRPGMKFEQAYDQALATTEGRRLYKTHADAVALRESAKG